MERQMLRSVASLNDSVGSCAEGAEETSLNRALVF